MLIGELDLMPKAEGDPSPWLRHKANQGRRASESPPYELGEGDLMGGLTLLASRRRAGLAAK